MKKLILFLTALCLMAMPVYAGSGKNMEKAYKKARKEKLKEFKKEGYKVYGTTKTLDLVLAEHYDKLVALGGDGVEYSGSASRCKSKNVGHQMAANSACLNYARSSGTMFTGKAVSEIFGDAAMAEGEYDKFCGIYQSNVEKEIRGELQESFTLYKDNGDGTFEIITYFILNEDAAATARLRALENSLRETEMATELTEKASELIMKRIE